MGEIRVHVLDFDIFNNTERWKTTFFLSFFPLLILTGGGLRGVGGREGEIETKKRTNVCGGGRGEGWRERERERERERRGGGKEGKSHVRL